MGAWRKTIEPQKRGNSPGPGPEVVERQRVANERAAQRVRSWTVQNEMRGVLGRVSAGAAGRILDSGDPRDKSLTVDCVRCIEDEREHSEHDEEAQVPRWRSREAVCQRILVPFSLEKRKVDRRNKEDCKGLQRARVALPVWPAHQPRRSPEETSVRGPIVV